MSEMSNDKAVPARPVKMKSNAPWVLGLIAFLLAIPNLMCQMMCKEAVSELDKATADVRQVVDATDKMFNSAKKAQEDASSTVNAIRDGNISNVVKSGKNTVKSTEDLAKSEGEFLGAIADKVDPKKESSAKSQKQTAEDAMKDFESFINGSFALCFGMFILSFFGKSKLSAITGILILAGAFVLFGWSMRWVQVLCCIEGILFIFSGIFSITNRKKVK
jgi:hypothetical protein